MMHPTLSSIGAARRTRSPDGSSSQIARLWRPVSLALCAALALGAWPAAAQAEDAGGEPVLLAQRGSRRSKRGQRKRPKKQAQKAERSKAEPDDNDDAGESADGSADVEAGEAAAGGEKKNGPRPSATTLRRSNRMEFDARLVRGETAGSGGVVLFDRGNRELPALTKTRTRFLEATLREVYDDAANGSGR